jgi:hypothetical protein
VYNDLMLFDAPIRSVPLIVIERKHVAVERRAVEYDLLYSATSAGVFDPDMVDRVPVAIVDLIAFPGRRDSRNKA